MLIKFFESFRGLLDENEEHEAEGDVANVAEEMVEVSEALNWSGTLEVVVAKILVS